tara:strand:+ start:8721 stop:9329 length:609 start_codon:yes stop_codon:yes gene_type:complete
MKTLIAKISDIQAKLNAPKGQYNSFGKYNYRSCEDILVALKPLLAQHGIIQTISDSMQVHGDRFYIKATATVTDGEYTICTHALARESLSKKGMDDSMITGTASSYARKYALNGMWLIDDSKDADTEEFRKQSTEKAQKEIISKSKEYISKDQKEELEELLIKAKVNNKAFMQFCKVSKLDDIEVSNYDSIYQKVNRKLIES